MCKVNQQLRFKVVTYILQIKENHQEISRNSVFLSISIFDLFLLRSVDSEQAKFSDQKLFAIACLLISWKFQGDSYPKIGQLLKTLGLASQCQKIQTKVIEIQEKILLKINFQIPLVTAYDTLDQAINEYELDDNQNRRDVAISIKILMTAIKFTSQLSLDPFLGARLHNVTKKLKCPDSKARSIYRKCLKLIHNEKIQKQNQIALNVVSQ